MNIHCPQCCAMYEGKLDSSGEALGGTRVRFFSATCDKHGRFSRQVVDSPFTTGVPVHLSERGTVFCPCCKEESPAEAVGNGSREIGVAASRFIQAECS